MVELAEDHQRVRAHPLREHRVAVGRADVRADLDAVALGNAEAPGGARVDDHAGVAAHVLRDFAHQRDRHVAAGMVLHALGREQPQREVVRVGAGILELLGPAPGHVVPLGQRRVFGELRVPPVHLLFVQPVAKLPADPQQPLLVRHLVAEIVFLERRREVPVELRHRHGVEAVLLEPFEVVRLGPARQARRRRLADRVPDRLDAMFPARVEGMVVVLALQRRSAPGAAVERRVVAFEQPGALRQFRADPREVARLALRCDRGLAQHDAAVLPELLDELRAADLDHLQRLEVGRLGQQHVGHPVGFIHRVGEAHRERERRDRIDQSRRVPERDRRVRAIDEPHVGQRRHGHRPVAGHLAQVHPRQLRRAQRLAPGAVADDRHERAVRVAPGRRRHPVFLVGRVEILRHEAVFAGLDADVAVIVRPVQPHRRAERAAGVLERADEGRQQRPRPAAFERTPAVVDRLAERHRDRAQRQGPAVDVDRRADRGRFEVFVGDAPDRRGRHVAHARRPFRGVFLHVLDEHRVRGRAVDVAEVVTFVIRVDTDCATDGEAPQKRWCRPRCVEGHGAPARLVPQQRLGACGVAQVQAIGADEVRRRGAIAQERHVELVQPLFAYQHVDQREHERRVGLRPDRHPFGRTGASDRQVRLDLHALVAAHARPGVARHRARAAGGFDVRTDRDHVVRERRVGRDRERAMPELAVQVLGVGAFHPLS